MSQYIKSRIAQQGALGYLLESSYLNTEALGATSFCDEIRAQQKYRWTPEGKCLNTVTGQLFRNGAKDQSQSNCTCLGPPPAQSGAAAAFEFLKKTLLPSPSTPGAFGPARSADPSFTASGLLVPAVLVVGGVGLLLVLKKKKK